ncbi:hypothetical protein U1Q18_021394 [Sarracenia purpurea var. burkii]
MIGLGCTANGELKVSKYSQPLPWIGVYIAAASAVCAIAMAADAIHGFRQRKFWFPCKSFSLNATTLTLITVATKLSVDLNTSMPRRQEQLVKLSSDAFLCTVICNSMPSLGTMETRDMSMNIVALGILVVTAIVNVGIQLGTGVIYVFWIQHAFVMLLMVVLLSIVISSALTIPTTKCFFDLKYTAKHKIATKECAHKCGKYSISEKLRYDLRKFWMMAHTCNPQFVIGRSATCTASGAFCLLSAMALAEAMLQSYLMPDSIRFCSGESDYKWSTTLVLVTQIIAVVAGTIAPAFRWFTAINFRCPKKASAACKPQFKVEGYWIQQLIDWKECPLALPFGSRHGRKLVHEVKNLFLELCIRLQIGTVVASKLIRLVSIFFMCLFVIFYCYCKELKRRLKFNTSITHSESGSESQPGSEVELSRYVLHLEGEESLVDLIIENNRDATHHFFYMGKKKQPKNLMRLLEKSMSFKELKGVNEFDSELIPSLDDEEPPNCWALPVVTLTSIAISLPGIDRHLIKELIRSVNEGLVFVRIVENNLDAKSELINIRKAAEILWLGIDLNHKWLDVDLDKIALQGKGPEAVLKGLADIAKNRFWEFRKKDVLRCLRENPSSWPVKVLAANSMYRISQTILLNYENNYPESSERLFERLSVMIADILCACLTNLPRVIPMESNRSTIEEREESVRHAIVLLGKVEKIMEILDQKPLPSLDTEQRACIDGWRSSSQEKKMTTAPQLISSSEVGNIAAFSSSDLYLSIE